MQSALTAKEQLTADTPLLFFDCTLADGSMQHWSSRTFTLNGTTYEGRLMKHNLFEAQAASDTQIGGPPKLTFELANADSQLSEIEQQSGFKGSKVVVQVVFADLMAGMPTSDPVVVFSGLMNPPDTITETSFRLSAINRLSTQRSVIPEVRVERMCPWRFPQTAAQRLEAVDGGADRGKYSPFYRCGYSPDQANGTGNMNGAVPFTDCARTRSDCQQRGMFSVDSSGRATAHFGGIEFIPPTIQVRGSGQKSYSLSAVQDNQASYNDFVPLVYGTQWHAPDVVFSRNDGNLTRMEVLLGMGPIEGILTVLVNNIEIPAGVSGMNMTSTGWYNVINYGTRQGNFDLNFTDGQGNAQGDPYGNMAYLSIVVPNRINDGTSIPTVQVLMQGMILEQFDTSGNSLGQSFSDNPAWVLLDILRRVGFALSEIATASFANVAAYAGQYISVDDPVGGQVQVERFQCNFALKDSRSAGDVVRAIRNASQIYVVLNSSGQLEARVENTFALQQSTLPAGSNATATFGGGWAAYEFDASSIARNADGSSSVKLTSKNAQDVPNRLSVEFQDEFNQYQQDSLSLSDGDDADLCGQEVAANWDAVGISCFNQATRSLLLGLNRGIYGNTFIEFQTSVKALGLLPGDLIAVTYLKENLQRTAFRILKITPGPSFRTATIMAQLHNDAWYGDAVAGIVGGRGWQSGQGSSLPNPVGGTVTDSNGMLQLGIVETETTGSDGSADVELDISFTSPSGQRGVLSAPLIGLAPVVSNSGGALAAGTSYFYAVSAIDSAGGESPLSFLAQATVPVGASSYCVVLTGIGLPAGAVSFNVYRGATAGQLFRIATAQAPAPSFTDTGFPPLTILPPDPQFDHVNVYWRWEFLPETAATTHSGTTIGNSILQMIPNRYVSATARITRGTGAGQEGIVASNDATTLTMATPWFTPPDATSFFAISESSFRFGATGATSPIPITVPERMGSGLQISARAANAADDEAEYALSPLTRWVVGQSGALAADSDVPPLALFGVTVSPVRGGVLVLSAPGFTNLANTTSVVAGTYTFHYYDEVNGAAPRPLTSAMAATDTTVALGITFVQSTYIQIGQEVILAAVTDASGNTAIQRAMHTTAAAAYPAGTLVYVLQEKVSIVPFVKGFFGSPAAGDWSYSLELPNVRLASVEFFATNALGNGAISAKSYTSTNDNGLRTWAGGQYSFQIAGYLAVQTSAAPPVVVDASRSVRDIYGVLTTPAQGAGVTLQLNLNGAPYATIQFDYNAATGFSATTSEVVDGFGLPALHAGDILTFDVDGVGTINPGSDLNLIMRL